MSRVIFHVDVNSAFLSWSAAYRVRVLGEQEDLRGIPSAVAGERAERHGIILAKSIPAKKCGVKTGEQIFLAQQKCPGLKLVPPDYALYVEASRCFIALLREFAPVVEQYSIDEAWADLSGTEGLYGSPVAAAELLRTRIREELGFTVNIGISSNKLLAKMAGEFEKPDKVHTLFPEEVPQKLWPLPVRELFMLGPATVQRGAAGAAGGKQGLWQFHNTARRCHNGGRGAARAAVALRNGRHAPAAGWQGGAVHFREPAERGFRHVFSPDDAAGGRARDGGAVPLRLPGLCRGMGRADAAAPARRAGHKAGGAAAAPA